MKRLDDLTVFFAVGIMKSGTTLLARILDQHPDIACIVESKLLDPFSSSSILNLRSRKWRRHGFNENLIKQAASYWHSPQLSLVTLLRAVTKQSWTFLYKSALSQYLHSAMSLLLLDFADRCNATIVGDKTPGQIGSIEILQRAFPNARFIYTIRDPRALWYSANQIESLDADSYLRNVLLADKKASIFQANPNLLTIRFEDLLMVPQETCEKVYGFLGCEFLPKYLEYDSGTDPYPERWYWISNSRDKLDAGIGNKWRSQMTPDQAEKITEMSAEFIAKYRYPVF